MKQWVVVERKDNDTIAHLKDEISSTDHDFFHLH